MTLKERIIVEVYTGYCMTSGNERHEAHKYIEEIMGRPVYTHELADKAIQEQLREKALPDFKALCITDEMWEEARQNVATVLSLCFGIGSAGYFGIMHLDSLQKRYSAGERTVELYEAMKEVH